MAFSCLNSSALKARLLAFFSCLLSLRSARTWALRRRRSSGVSFLGRMLDATDVRDRVSSLSSSSPPSSCSRRLSPCRLRPPLSFTGSPVLDDSCTLSFLGSLMSLGWLYRLEYVLMMDSQSQRSLPGLHSSLTSTSSSSSAMDSIARGAMFALSCIITSFRVGSRVFRW
uniref:Putative secreted protein n=1 Tax=Ixodes ricinus TaxID=34613 RepID=A0A6B0UY48_IXORI